MFLQASVILLRGGLSQCMLGYTPPEQTPWNRHPLGADILWSRHPQEQTPPEQTSPQSRHPPEQTLPRADTPQADTPLEQIPPEQTPLEQTLPLPEQTPLQEADSSIWSTSGRYTSYWNAFLCCKCALNMRFFTKTFSNRYQIARFCMVTHLTDFL